jgi:hypothetical protein
MYTGLSVLWDIWGDAITGNTSLAREWERNDLIRRHRRDQRGRLADTERVEAAVDVGRVELKGVGQVEPVEPVEDVGRVEPVKDVGQSKSEEVRDVRFKRIARADESKLGPQGACWCQCPPNEGYGSCFDVAAATGTSAGANIPTDNTNSIRTTSGSTRPGNGTARGGGLHREVGRSASVRIPLASASAAAVVGVMPAECAAFAALVSNVCPSAGVVRQCGMDDGKTPVCNQDGKCHVLLSFAPVHNWV